MKSTRGPWVAAFASLLLAAAYHAGTLGGDPALLGLDDGYIHARLAENLVSSGVLGINPGQGGGGSSSLLWTLLVAGGVAAGFGGDLSAGFLSWASLGFAVFMASRLFFDVLRPAPAWIASVVLALAGQNAALSLSGMESLLFAGFVVAGLREETLGRGRRSTLFLSIAALVRVEAILAAAACFAGRWLSRPDLPPRRRVVAGLPPLAAVALTALAATGALAILGRGAPATLAARRWLYGMGDSLLPGIEQWTGPIAYLVEDLWLRLVALQGPGGLPGALWAAVVTLAGAVGTIALGRDPRRVCLPLYILAQSSFVVFILGSDSHLSRYLAPVWIVAPLVVVRGLQVLGRGHRPGALGVLVIAALLVGCSPQLLRWSRWHRETIEHLRSVHLRMASRVAEVVPAGEPVAGFDVGLLSFKSGREIVDIGGLTDPAMVGAMRRATVPERLEQTPVRFAVFPEAISPGARHVYAVRLGFRPAEMGAPLARTTAATADKTYLRATKVAMPALALYELRRGRESRDRFGP